MGFALLSRHSKQNAESCFVNCSMALSIAKCGCTSNQVIWSVLDYPELRCTTGGAISLRSGVDHMEFMCDDGPDISSISELSGKRLHCRFCAKWDTSYSSRLQEHTFLVMNPSRVVHPFAAWSRFTFFYQHIVCESPVYTSLCFFIFQSFSGEHASRCR